MEARAGAGGTSRGPSAPVESKGALMARSTHRRLLAALLVAGALHGAGCGTASKAPAERQLGILGSEDCEARPPLVALTTFQPASLVLGQPDFASADRIDVDAAQTAAGVLTAPSGLGCGSLWVADFEDSRVLRYPVPFSLTNGLPHLVLGQPDYASRGAAPASASSLNSPTAVEQKDGKLFVCDHLNHRVLIWSSVLLSDGAPADVVLGQPDFTTDAGPSVSTRTTFTPSDLAVAAGRLLVADKRGRVLIWLSIPSVNATPPDRVIGAPDFTTRSELATSANIANAAGIWSDGTRIAVADAPNDRVLIWTSFPLANGQPADLVLGQPDMGTSRPGTTQSGMDGPLAVDSNGTQLAVLDAGNHRVLVWNTFPTQNGQPADVVLGQSGFTTGAPNDSDQDGHADDFPGPRTFNFNEFGGPRFSDLRFSGVRLYVTDAGNHRVLAFE